MQMELWKQAGTVGAAWYYENRRKHWQTGWICKGGHRQTTATTDGSMEQVACRNTWYYLNVYANYGNRLVLHGHLGRNPTMEPWQINGINGHHVKMVLEKDGIKTGKIKTLSFSAQGVYRGLKNLFGMLLLFKRVINFYL